MSDISTIKERIRKLMAVAGDGVAMEGEIENALSLAARLLDKHHLSMDEVEESAESQIDDSKMDRAFAVSQSTRFSTWESTLASGICKLFGCVKYYISGERAVQRVNGVAVMKGEDVAKGVKICFYGPATEADEAADLFEEWARSIATMGVIRWGGCFRGDGAMYCMGFVSALYKQASKLNADRMLVEAKPLPLLPGESSTTSTSTGAITLTNRYDMLKARAENWLKKECGVYLSKGSGRSGYSSGSSEAYSEGNAHGSKAQFGRNARRRQIGH
jgi:hypothetical protein